MGYIKFKLSNRNSWHPDIADSSLSPWFPDNSVVSENCLPSGILCNLATVSLKEDIYEYFKREVLPHVPDAWIDESKVKVGYEIPLNRHFYEYTPPRPLAEIESDIKAIERDILKMLGEVTG